MDGRDRRLFHGRLGWSWGTIQVFSEEQTREIVFRLDAGHDVHQMPDMAKQQVPEYILKKAREIAKAEYAKKLREIQVLFEFRLKLFI